MHNIQVSYRANFVSTYFYQLFFSTYILKYTEIMFGMSAGDASIKGGSVLIGAGVVGQLISGLTIGSRDPKIKTQIQFIIIILSLATIMYFSFNYTCGDVAFAGGNLEYQ